MIACPHPHCSHRPASTETLDAHVAAAHGKGMFRLVRAEASEAILHAMDEAYMPFGEMLAVHDALLAASPPPTDAELRELARLMWSDKPYWGRPDLPKSQPTEALCQDDIARMKRFLAALTGAKP